MIEIESRVGLIAGSGRFPVAFAESARSRGISVFAVAHQGETDPCLGGLVDKILWIRIGQVKAGLRFISENNIRQVAFAGGISRVRLFRNFKPDMLALSIIARAGSLRDDAILRRIARELEERGVSVIPANALLEKLTPEAGQLTKRGMTLEEARDAVVAFTAAREAGRLDIGQSAVAFQSLVVAVEAVEGTDAAIRRAGGLAGTSSETRESIGRRLMNGCGAKGGPVVVNLCKPQQDLRLDLPTVGPQTIETMAASGAKALILEAGKSIILDPETVIRLADGNGIAIHTVESREALERIAEGK